MYGRSAGDLRFSQTFLYCAMLQDCGSLRFMQQRSASRMASVMKIKRGLDVPVSGRPVQQIVQGSKIGRVGIVAADYVGLRPALSVRDGDRVRLGQTLLTEKSCPEIRFTAPAAGRVLAVHRGEKRKLVSVEIEVDGDEEERFATSAMSSMTGQLVRQNLAQSGLWTALRTRPFNRIPRPDSAPAAIFVTAIDTNPLAADPLVILAEEAEDFEIGLHALTHLTDGPVYACHAEGATLPGNEVPRVRTAAFSGPHPAGLPGTHIHFLMPVSAQRTVWFVGYQDVIAFGMLFRTGRIRTERVVSVAGPGVERPYLVRTRLGACLDALTRGNLTSGEMRIVSGSLLSGRQSEPLTNYLGRYHLQVSVLPEGRRRELFGWQMPGFDKYSVTRTFSTAWFGGLSKVAWNTSTHGSRRAMVPIGVYERVVPLDILPTQLLRALLVGDTDEAQLLGCLELDEDDLGLCSFVCPSKYDFGPVLRENLTTIEREG